jgi:hypothetical protein
VKKQWHPYISDPLSLFCLENHQKSAVTNRNTLKVAHLSCPFYMHFRVYRIYVYNVTVQLNVSCLFPCRQLRLVMQLSYSSIMMLHTMQHCGDCGDLRTRKKNFDCPKVEKTSINLPSKVYLPLIMQAWSQITHEIVELRHTLIISCNQFFDFAYIINNDKCFHIAEIVWSSMTAWRVKKNSCLSNRHS